MNLIEQYIIPGLSLLPQNMDTPNARAMLVAIGLQESGFRDRKQVGGPARGFWQFERGGVNRGGIYGILTHPKTKDIIEGVCRTLYVPADADICYGLVAYHDVLACCFARLLLWTLPGALPGPNDPDEGWRQYMAAWRPGKPRPNDWPENFKRAWKEVKA